MASPRRYAIIGAGAVGNPRTISQLTSTAAIRPAIYDVQIGFASPADNSIQWRMRRYTAVGTSTAVTPRALDTGDPAAIATAGQNSSAEPTYTANSELIDEELNQRASYRWVAAPGGELLLPATANNGIGLETLHASATPTCRVTIHYAE